MKKVAVFLVSIIVCLQFTSSSLFAQTITPVTTSQKKTTESSPTITPTKAPSSTTIPSPTGTPAQKEPTPSPTEAMPLTTTPTPQPLETPIPQTDQSLTKTPTPTQKPAPVVLKTSTPTPTPTPQPLVQGHMTTNAVQFLSAPFALFVDLLPGDVYSDRGLSPKTTNLLLSIAGACIILGGVLLLSPSLTKIKNRTLVRFQRKDEYMPYLSGRI